jgi:broad specificity phosphatase PhoE
MARTGQEVILCRHGETAWTISRQHTGSTDIPLTELGKVQAALLGRRLSTRSFDTVLSSPLSRAAETCRLAGLGREMQTRGDLVEWDYGAYEGRTTADIRAEKPGWNLWHDGAPEGETAADVGRRVDRVIEELRSGDGDVAVFAHGHLLRVFTARWLGLDPECGCGFALSTATLSVLGWERENPVVWLWNDDGHLTPEVTGTTP